jgi:catechol 2,3-dioxygenase-like lactoylglutathione lyase family enzyme
MPRVTGVLETCLYVADVDRSARISTNASSAFERMLSDDRLCAFAITAENSRGQEIAAREVLILFRQGATAEPSGAARRRRSSRTTAAANRISPLPFRAEELPAWEKRAWPRPASTIESRVRWERGGDSLYFRDPDGHLAELATPGIWPIY